MLCISHAIAAGFTWRPTLRPSHLVQLRPQIHFAEFSLSQRQLFQASTAAWNGILENWRVWNCVAQHSSAMHLQEMPVDTGGGSRFAPLMQTDVLIQQELFYNIPPLLPHLHSIFNIALSLVCRQFMDGRPGLNSRNITITKEHVFQL